MRVNIYTEETPRSCTIVQDGEFFGARLFLQGAQPVPGNMTPEKDTRSAVTFWFRRKDICERFLDAVTGVLTRVKDFEGVVPY